MNILQTLRIGGAGLLAVSIIGCSCAKKEDLDAVRVEAAQARKTADEAVSAARGAEERARNAEARAQSAEEAVNRGFKKSMRK